MKSDCHFYLDRAAACLDMAEHVDSQYRGDLMLIARGWVRLAQEEFVPPQAAAAEARQPACAGDFVSFG